MAIPIVMQYLHLGNWHEAITWVTAFNGSYKVNVYIVAILFGLFYALCNSAFYSFITVVGICGVFTIVDMQKMRILNQPLLPGDLLFVKQALLIARMYAREAMLGGFCLAALCVVLFLVRKKVVHFKLPLSVRGVLFTVIALFITYAALNYSNVINKVNSHFLIVNEYWNQLTNFKKNGVLYSFFMNLESLVIARPHDYNRQNITTIFSHEQEELPLPAAAMSPPPPLPSSIQNPDVIIYMSESFWDITQIAPKPLPRDPIPVFRSLSKKKPYTKLVSPVFGGNTCNAEFEVLTGLSHGFFPPGVMAYNQLIQHPIPSMVKVFKENGYEATAIHTFKRWFWNRVNVYRQLGFDSFISVESMENPRIKGFYVADSELVTQVIRQASLSQKPDFIFALSMQNHGPYNVKRYDSLDCHVSTGLSQPADQEFNSYLQGLIDADASLGILKHYIDTVHQPTLLVFFGDHLPGFTDYYKEAGIAERIDRDTLWAHTTKAVWYANYTLQKGMDSMINMMYMPLLITKQAGIKVPEYYRYLDRLRSEFPVLSDEMRTKNSLSDDSLFAHRKNECKLCVYDALLGKRYSDRYHHINTDSAVGRE
jgi:phosphoglycerol transferase MdoB-like AlkP superfamily enzyme